MGFAPDNVMVPRQMLPLLALCDGNRDIKGLQSGYLLRTGVRLDEETVDDVIKELDAALLLENGRYQSAENSFMEQFRAAKYRRPAHVGNVYPANPQQLEAQIQDYVTKIPEGGTLQSQCEMTESKKLIGMICPHIDYARGHKTYAELWERAKPHLNDIELLIILGTDHNGGLGMITPTRQNYSTPHGILETDTKIVDELATILETPGAFKEEIHHVREHSIELASVWAHHYMGGRDCLTVPVLCGSFNHFAHGDGSPSETQYMVETIQYLKKVTEDKRTLIIVAGDLAHVGPAFGEEPSLDEAALAKLAEQDRRSLKEICSIDPEAFLERSRREKDARRICGLSPIYIGLKLMGSNVCGEWLGYDQCSADATGGSVVSVAGALFYES